MTEGQQRSHAGSHIVAWGRSHTVPVPPRPQNGQRATSLRNNQIKGAALADRHVTAASYNLGWWDNLQAKRCPQKK